MPCLRRARIARITWSSSSSTSSMVFSPTPVPPPLAQPLAAHYSGRGWDPASNEKAPGVSAGGPFYCRSSRLLGDALLDVLLGRPDAGILGVLGSLVLLLQPPLGIDGRAATVGGGGYGLAVAGVGDVTRGEDAGDARHGVLLL